MPVTGTVYVDLAEKYELARNRMWFALEATPDSAKIIVHVGKIPPALVYDAFRFLLEHEHRLHIEVQGEAEAVRQWYKALTTRELFGGEAIAV